MPSLPLLTRVTKTDGRDTVSAGEFLIYRIVVRNDGDASATSVTVVDRVPHNLLPDMGSMNPSATADPTTRTITWSTKSIPAHTEKTFTFRAQVDPSALHGFLLHNVVDVTAPGFLGSAVDRTTVIATAAPALKQPAPRVKGASTLSTPRPVPVTVETGLDMSTMFLGLGGFLSGTGAYLGRKRRSLFRS